jgi:hypothetical protein
MEGSGPLGRRVGVVSATMDTPFICIDPSRAGQDVSSSYSFSQAFSGSGEDSLIARVCG